jgi:hypothetical protein
MGQVHVWKYIFIVARNPSSVLSRNRKTELRLAMEKGAYPEYLASGMGPMGTQEYDLTQLQEYRHTSRSSDVHISGPDGTGIQGLLQGDRYLFDDHRVAKSAKWTVDSQVSWLDTVAEARQAYTVSLMRLRGLFEGKS